MICGKELGAVRSNGGDEHSIGLSVAAHIEVVAAAIDEADFLVKSDGTGVSFPHTEPKIPSVKFECRTVNCPHESLGNAGTVSRAIHVEAVQLGRRVDGDAGRRFLAEDLREGDEGFIAMRQQSDHVRILEFLRLLGDSESLFQVSAEILGSILAAKSFLESARSQ